jgi:hypothetical protein
MSLTPDRPSGMPIPDSESEKNTPTKDFSDPGTHRKIGWQRRLLRISLALFVFEIGAFLAIFPWTESWNINYFQTLTPWLQDLWYQPSFRGALTGLGFVNIYIACLQVVGSLRRR